MVFPPRTAMRGVLSTTFLLAVTGLSTMITTTPASAGEETTVTPPTSPGAGYGYSDGDGNTGGSALVNVNPGFGDSLLEVDRTLNFNRGDGSSAGSDNEGD